MFKWWGWLRTPKEQKSALLWEELPLMRGEPQTPVNPAGIREPEELSNADPKLLHARAVVAEVLIDWDESGAAAVSPFRYEEVTWAQQAKELDDADKEVEQWAANASRQHIEAALSLLCTPPVGTTWFRMNGSEEDGWDFYLGWLLIILAGQHPATFMEYAEPLLGKDSIRPKILEALSDGVPEHAGVYLPGLQPLIDSPQSLSAEELKVLLDVVGIAGDPKQLETLQQKLAPAQLDEVAVLRQKSRWE